MFVFDPFLTGGTRRASVDKINICFNYFQRKFNRLFVFCISTKEGGAQQAQRKSSLLSRTLKTQSVRPTALSLLPWVLRNSKNKNSKNKTIEQHSRTYSIRIPHNFARNGRGLVARSRTIPPPVRPRVVWLVRTPKNNPEFFFLRQVGLPAPRFSERTNLPQAVPARVGERATFGIRAMLGCFETTNRF
jgi:hypothetical protein